MNVGLRRIAGRELRPIGFGCMNLSHGYGNPPPEKRAIDILQKAIDLGVTHFDTAALYGFGHNEALVGRVLKPYRDRILLTSKCGLHGVDGKRVIDGRPESLRKMLDASLQRLQTDVIDVYYLHRWDKSVPIEHSVGEMSRMVERGNVRALGLCEVSVATLQKAHAVHPIAAVQSEYSLWTRNPEIGVLDACAEIGAAFVAFSPLGRGFLTDIDVEPATFVEIDVRRAMPRFRAPHFEANARLLAEYRKAATDSACTPAQLALAWLLQKAPHILPIPGTTSLEHLVDNVAAASIALRPTIIAGIEALVNEDTVAGGRYSVASQAEIDTEEFV